MALKSSPTIFGKFKVVRITDHTMYRLEHQNNFLPNRLTSFSAYRRHYEKQRSIFTICLVLEYFIPKSSSKSL
ncbi:MAG: hypothetical protein Mars2KO_00900 [Maribacter sp.]